MRELIFYFSQRKRKSREQQKIFFFWSRGSKNIRFDVDDNDVRTRRHRQEGV